MTDIDRRTFVSALALTGLVPAAGPTRSTARAPALEAGDPTEVTRQLARYVVHPGRSIASSSRSIRSSSS